MILIPAIDLKEGQCVRLRQGRMDDATVFSNDPVATAEHWLAEGCRRLHIVDLDGAFAGHPKNAELISTMVTALGEVPVQVGGGIRSTDIAAAYFDAGVANVIIGTQAIREPAFLAKLAQRYPQQVTLGIDARGGRVAVSGWDEEAAVDAMDLARSTADLPLASIVYTDIDRDGMLQGLNVNSTRALAEVAGAPVIASGGVTNLNDLKQLQSVFADAPHLLLGAITGRAIYERELDFSAGQKLLDELNAPRSTG